MSKKYFIFICISNCVSAVLIDFKSQDQTDIDNFLSYSPIYNPFISSNNVLFYFLRCVTLLKF